MGLEPVEAVLEPLVVLAALVHLELLLGQHLPELLHVLQQDGAQELQRAGQKLERETGVPRVELYPE